MWIDSRGTLVDTPTLRAGCIGCGSHAFRNIYPALQFAPVELAAVCDLSLDKARAFASTFGAPAAYADYRDMLEKESLDAVFVVVGYDRNGRPQYPAIAADCLEAGCHAWIEKPPAATVAELDALEAVARKTGRQVAVGFKKMFAPANEKARDLMDDPSFGAVTLANFQYPQSIPTTEEFRRYIGERVFDWEVLAFLDHLCHPVSLLVFLMGPPDAVCYERSDCGAGAALFRFESGAVATLSLTRGAALNGGMERTLLLSDQGRQILVENNIRVSYLQGPAGLEYGRSPDFYEGAPGQASAFWEPEFSLGQLYNKGLFLLGYCGEIREFAAAVLENRPLRKGHLAHARQVTQVFEAFSEGPGRFVRIPRQDRT